MAPARADQLSVSIVGPGRLGTALALNLRRAGWKVERLVVRPGGRVRQATTKLARLLNAKVMRLGEGILPAGLIWITVPDDAIAAVASQFAEGQRWKNVTVFHSSGTLTSDVLWPLRSKGARVASVHPGMTFVHKVVPSFAGVPFGVEGDAAALRLAKKIVADLEGGAHTIRKENKVLYHAFDTFASPLLIGLMTALEQVGREAGIEKSQIARMAGPLLRQTLDNYLRHGTAAAFSGALIRGDVATVRRHLDALQKIPTARDAYRAVARVAIEQLPVKNRAALRKALR
jgi:predicted short-subunit dehydrogenase-like oxidoreductase (DUF2520 family)